MSKTVAEIVRVGCYALTRDGSPLGHIAVLPLQNGWHAVSSITSRPGRKSFRYATDAAEHRWGVSARHAIETAERVEADNMRRAMRS